MEYRISEILLLSYAFLLQFYSAVEEHSDICFYDYIERTTNASNTYATHYRSCLELGEQFNTTYPLHKKAERREIERSVAALCADLQSCNGLQSDVEFFQCQARIGGANVNNLMLIQANATVELVNLNEHYSEATKKFKLCTIEARQQHRRTSTDAYNGFLLCLNEHKS